MGGSGGAAAEEEEEDVRAGATGCWRRVLQDCGNAIYAAPALSSEPYVLT